MSTTANRDSQRIGPSAAIAGAIVLFVGTYLHPMSADPNVAIAAFTEYAADPHWVMSHLLQLFGIMLIAAALTILARRLADGPGAGWAALGLAGAIASLSVTAALQAVDGVALKVMVDSWAASLEPARSMLFAASFAVRQIEAGLASMTSLMFGLTASIYGIALLLDGRFPRWLGVGAIVGGVPTAIAGVVIAYTGFSGFAMAINMPANSLLILWMIALGIHGWSRASF